MADELLALMLAGIPLLTAVKLPYLDAWRQFTGGMAVELPADDAARRPGGMPAAPHRRRPHEAARPAAGVRARTAAGRRCRLLAMPAQRVLRLGAPRPHPGACSRPVRWLRYCSPRWHPNACSVGR
jgi:hypothetical protein